MKHILAAAFTLAAALGAGGANATITTVFNDIPTGTANFNSTVASAGGTATAQQLTSGTSVYTDFSLSKSVNSSYSDGGKSTTGGVMTINPAGPSGTPRANPLAYQPSGFTATFNKAVNSIGFEVGDWGTCCQPSALYISFDNGAPIKVGQSNTVGDVQLNGSYLVFVGAFDDSDDFTTVSFWGDGVGEALYAGGTIRYALLDQGSLPGVPEPTTWAMMIGGVGMTGGALRRRGKRALRLA